MKNAPTPFLKSITTFVVLLITAGSCKPEPEPRQEPDPKSQESDNLYEVGILLPKEAQILFDNYDKRRVGIIQQFEDAFDEENPDYRKQNPSQNGELGGNDDFSDSNGERFDVARYVYYDYEDIKKYLAYIEQEAKLSGENISTLRFYFGNYAEKIDESVKHPRQNTIMISPTIKRNDKENIFFTVDGENGKREAVLVGDYFDGSDSGKANQVPPDDKNKASLVPSPFSSSSAKAPMFAARGTTKNEGSSAPPPHANQ